MGNYTVSVGNTNKSNLYLATGLSENPGASEKAWFSHGSVGLTTHKTYTAVDTFYIYFSNSIDKVAQVLDAVGYLQVEAGTKATAHAPYVSTSIPITLPAEHPYLAALPDGTHDEIVIDKDGNASLVARVGNAVIPAKYDKWGEGCAWYSFPKDGAIHITGVDVLSDKLQYGKADEIYKGVTIGISIGDIFLSDVVSTCVFIGDNDIANIIGSTIYYKLMTPVTYSLGKLDIPSIPETISNVWTDAELATNMSMTYKQDVNIIIADLTAQVAALKGTNDIVHDDSTASPDDAIGVPDNDVQLI